MWRTGSLFGLLALVSVMIVAARAPAAAEVFSCNDRPGQLLYSYSGTPDQYTRRQRHSASRSYGRRSSTGRHRQATYHGSVRYWNDR